ncbi:hypothetical protein ABTZ59_35155 [Streptomyces sp. NPDC094034]|uniref:hypothetical protein n=1 Tax=Streptomyces sp. NPDC094034 TaxID=3155309 RepID=UPI00331D92A3
MRKLYESERDFQVWRYAVSHRSLLLRSVKSDSDAASRIDIYFGHIELMLLRPRYEGVSIYEAEADDPAEIQDRFGVSVSAEGTFMFGSSRASGTDGFAGFEMSGLVISGPPARHEDNGSAKDPSFFQNAMGYLL